MPIYKTRSWVALLLSGRAVANPFLMQIGSSIKTNVLIEWRVIKLAIVSLILLIISNQHSWCCFWFHFFQTHNPPIYPKRFLSYIVLTSRPNWDLNLSNLSSWTCHENQLFFKSNDLFLFEVINKMPAIHFNWALRQHSTG